MYKGRKKQSIMYFAVKSVDKCQKPRVLQEVRGRLSLAQHLCDSILWVSFFAAQVRTLHTLDHANILKFYAWSASRRTTASLLCTDSNHNEQCQPDIFPYMQV